MQYLHIKNLEQYNPGYTDRTLIWCKIYFNMLNTSYDFDMLDDIDRWRFIALIMLELQIKKPIPYDEKWLQSKITRNKRPISMTIKMLHNFVELSGNRNETVTQSRVDKSRVEENRIEKKQDIDKYPFLKEDKFYKTWENFLLMRHSLKKPPTDYAQELALKQLHKVDMEVAVKMLEQSIINSWKGIFPLKEIKNGRYQRSDKTGRAKKLADVGQEV